MQKSRHLVVVLSLSCCLCACSDDSRPWWAYGTHKERGDLEYFFDAAYATRSDCLFGVWRTVEKRAHSQYRKPYGCMYVGSQNPYVLYIINWYFAKDALRCIGHSLSRDGSISIYRPILKSRYDLGDEWYCYL